MKQDGEQGLSKDDYLSLKDSMKKTKQVPDLVCQPSTGDVSPSLENKIKNQCSGNRYTLTQR